MFYNSMIKSKGFSLIELLVVVSILAIIAAIAVPAYTQYKNRVIVHKTFDQMRGILADIQKTIETTGTAPSSLSYAGATINNGSLGTINFDNIYHMYFESQTSGQKKHVRIDASIKGLSNISGYSDPSTAGWATGSVLRMVMDIENGTATIYCGVYGTSGNPYASQELSSTYVPRNCTCTQLGNYFYFLSSTC